MDAETQPKSRRTLGYPVFGSLQHRRRSRRMTPQQATMGAGRRIVRKYRKFAKNLEYRRLRAIVPAVANNDRASKVGFNNKEFHFSKLTFIFSIGGNFGGGHQIHRFPTSAVGPICPDSRIATVSPKPRYARKKITFQI